MSERITLEDLKPADGATHKIKRVGRGRASGHGKTSTRGNNGEGQRSGRSSKKGFEGGQMPAFRRLPKLKGFKNFNALKSAAINVKDIESLDTDTVDLIYLIENAKIHPSSETLRILGTGEISKAVTVKANHFSASAKEKIEKAGGKAELV